MSDTTPIPASVSADAAVANSGGPESGASAPAGPKVDVFLSYNSKDHEEVLRLAEGLTRAGFAVFVDRWDLAPGLRWRQELERVIASCGAVLVMVGPHGLGEVQEREVDVALRRQDKDRGFPVVPVLLPESTPPGGFLEPLTWVDLRHLAPELSVDRLVAVLRRERGRDGGTDDGGASRRRYLANLLVLFGILAVAAAWYWRHLQTVTAVAFGGSLGLPLLLWLTVLYVRWGAEGEIKSLPRRLLGSRGSTRGLSSVLALVALVFAGTSSVQVTAVGGPDGGEPRSVEVRSTSGRALWKSPVLAGERRVASRLFFFRWGQAGEVVLDPAGDRGSVPVRFGPAARTMLRVPADFPPRAVSVVRVLPGGGLLQVLGRPGASVNRKFDLTVSGGSATLRVSDLRRQAVYVGRDEAEVGTGLGREPEETRRARFESWAKERLGLPQSPARDVATMWTDTRVLGGWEPPQDLAGLVCELVGEGASAPERLVSTVIDETDGIRTLLVDRSR